MPLPLKPSPAFAEFLLKFPEIELPATLGEDTHHTFSTENEPLTEAMVAAFIGEPEDEFTEFVPCFMVGATEQFVAVVWWKAGLLNYEYFLATFKLDGQPVARRVIASTRASGDSLALMVAHITPELVVYIAEGRGNLKELDPLSRHTFTVQFLPNGEFFQTNAALN